ncbi:hypothetical protein [Parasedimentitalea maritima]|uniref:hypothetical protein n=1 Tax=Parasedimentitalea maritima TaxID=2578117 RepID=UPI001FE9C4C2|nr:hypothetical protein [Zongyanglinia marina]
MIAPVPDYVFSRRGRSARLVTAVAIWLASLVGIGLYFHAALLLLGALFLPLLPALWELWLDPLSCLHLTGERINWKTGSQEAGARLCEISKVRFDTRWDFSVRVTLILTTGDKLRLPPQVLPPHHMLENALQLRGVQTERHHFTVF